MIALCLTGSALGWYMLYRDFTMGGGGEGGPVMAIVERRDARVRKRPKGTYMWQPVAEQTKLYRKEYVQTGDGGGAVIKFTDGTTLELKEKSLVIIDDASQLSLNFVQGEGVLKTSEGDAKISVAETGKATVEKLDVKLLSPEPLSEFLSTAQIFPVEFKWTSKTPAEGVALEVSRAQEFPKSTTKILKPGKESGARLSVGAGDYFWRITKDGQPVSDVSRFTILAAPSFRLLSPASGGRADAWGKGASIPFRWTAAGVTPAFESRLQIATSTDFAAPVYDQKIAAENGQTQVSALEPGKYFWRIVSTMKKEIVMSDVAAFEFGFRQSLPIAATAPEVDSAQPLPKELRFAWNSPDTSGELSYTLTVQRDGSDLVNEDVGGAQTWIWKSPKSGTLRWRITAKWKDQKVGESPWSEFSLFEDEPLKLVAPEAGKKIQFWDDAAPVDFEWSPDAMLKQGDYVYEFHLSTRADFQDAVVRERVKTSGVKAVKLNPKSGQYYWRVSVLGKNGKPVKASAPQTLTLSLFATLPPPADGRLGSGLESFNPVENNNVYPPLQWSKVEEAKAYEVTLFKMQGTVPKQIQQATTDKPSLDLPALEAGEYRWTLRTVDRLNRKGEVGKPQSFTIVFPKILPAPEIKIEEVEVQ